MNNHQHIVLPSQIKKWVNEIAYQLDNPGLVTLNEINSVVRDWEQEPYKSDLKFCLCSPVEYSAVVSNLGMSILYQEINQNGEHPTSTGVLCERCYFPEKKLLSRLQKNSYPIFSKENFVPLKNFDVVGFSSYYPLQYFNFPRMLEMSGIPAWSKDRDGENAPIVMGGGISFFNPEPVSDFFDFFFLGEGEAKLLQILQDAKKFKTPTGGIDKKAYLEFLATNYDFIYVPEFYSVEYFKGFGVKKRTMLKDFAKPVVSRALANINKIKPLTRTFVPVIDSADMSIGSVEISRGKVAANSRVLVNGSWKKISDLHSYKGKVSALKGGSIQDIDLLDHIAEPRIQGEELYRIRTAKGSELILSSEHPVFVNGSFTPAISIKKGDSVATVANVSNTKEDYAIDDVELCLVAAFMADGTLSTSKHRFSIFKKTKEEILYVAHLLSYCGIDYFLTEGKSGYIISTKTGEKEDILKLKPEEREQAFFNSNAYKLFDKWGLISKKSGEKILPDFVNDFSKRQVKVFLNALLSFDGSICLSGNARGINLGSKSREQCIFIKELLLQFGVISRVPFTMNGGAYQVQIRNFATGNLARAIDLFDDVKFDNSDKIKQLAKLNGTIDESLLSEDFVPYKAWIFFEQLKKDLNLTWSEINKELVSYASTNNIPRKKSRTGNRVSRDFILKAYNSSIFNKYVRNNTDLHQIISKDIYWDTIQDISKVPSVDCCDITTECPVHSYVTNTIITHNCSASCAFCEGSARTMPLRERPTELAKKCFDEVMQNTGSMDITPYGFNLSDHSNVRTLINYLAKNQDVKIQMSSQRIDMFTEDFAKTAYLTGNRSLTLAIEAGSEKMRSVINKNLTQQQILEAFEIAMRCQFNKVKIYMIANLPFETQEDITGIPVNLTDTNYEGATEYPNEEAYKIVFDDNSKVTISKNYFFQLPETDRIQAEDVKPGTTVVYQSKTKKVITSEKVTTTLYGPASHVEDSLLGLMAKLAERRDYWANVNGKECVLNWSYTPFTSKNATPFEYASCIAGLSNKKTLTPAVEAARKYGFKFRVGTSSDTSAIAQVLTLGDRRLNQLIYDGYKSGVIQYFGGMSAGKDAFTGFEQLLKKIGHTYETYSKEKYLCQIFPWSFIDVGLTEEYRKERYLLSKAAANSDFGCFNRCDSCGACMVSQENLPQDAFINAEKQFEVI